MTETQADRHTFPDITGHWINGKTSATTEAAMNVVSPATGAVVATIPSGTAEDVDAAVAAARAAWPGWAATAPGDRAQVITGLAQKLTERVEEIAQAVTAEIGSPITLSRFAQAAMPPAVAASVAGAAAGLHWTEEIANSLVVREPVGVVGAITPWNFPLQQIMTKMAPALVAGNTMVFKPSELAPLTARILAEAAAEAGVPDGVFNVVYGTGPAVGEAIASHPGIDMVTFTGSTAVGKRISVLAAATVKRVALELGGKSASVVLEDADLNLAVESTLRSAFINSGQVCGAWTRMIVPASKQEQIVQLITQAAGAYTVGDPDDEATGIGPLASEKQWERVNGYIERGIADGATLVLGGPGRIPGLEHGAYIRPTVFSGVDPDSAIAQEEIFGPVLAVIPYTGEDEAVAIANNSIYGLAGAVFGEPERALRVAMRMRTGQVDINAAQFNLLAPFGGYKQSGHGREFGRIGIEVKSIQRGPAGRRGHSPAGHLLRPRRAAPGRGCSGAATSRPPEEADHDENGHARDQAGRLGSAARVRPHPRGGCRCGETAAPGSGRVADQRRCASRCPAGTAARGGDEGRAAEHRPFPRNPDHRTVRGVRQRHVRGQQRVRRRAHARRPYRLPRGPGRARVRRGYRCCRT
jgi:aldehyde dehydrogenase (NAD+)